MGYFLPFYDLPIQSKSSPWAHKALTMEIPVLTGARCDNKYRHCQLARLEHHRCSGRASETALIMPNC